MNLPIVQNYHKHTDDTNPMIMDSSMTYDMLAKRTIECGGNILSSVSHSWQGRYHICWEIAKKYGLKFIFGTEAYWVKDRFEKDNTNAHIIILAKNENGMEDINEILSIANEEGFYYRPRIDLDLIFNKLTKSDVFITSSCIAGHKYKDIDDIWIKMYEHFGDNFMLEIQNHNTLEQKELNKKILHLHKKYGIKMIVGLDSHFISPEQSVDRDDLLASKHIQYHESEINWFLDYPTNQEIYDRFIEQGVFTSEEIIQAMKNTNVILDFEDIEFDRNMKLPTIYPEKTQEEKNELFKEIINKEFKAFIKKNNISKEKRQEYIKAIQDEAQIILNTDMADYFLLNYEIIKKGKEKGGVITPSGRGCFTETALVHTKDSLKQIKDVKVGDYVITQSGTFNKVLDTMEYEVEEDMVKIETVYGSNKYFPNICTLDHKILIHNKDENKNEWKQAKDITTNDYVCVPKMKIEDESNEYIDLNEYNIFGFDYDDEYIYEYVPNGDGNGEKPEYAPKRMAEILGIDKQLVKMYANIESYPNYNILMPTVPSIMENFKKITGFQTREEYCEYLKRKRIRRIKRYIKNDYIHNAFIGIIYGNGYIRRNSVGISINLINHKNVFNRNIIIEIFNRLENAIFNEVKSNSSNKKSDLIITSKIFSNYINNFVLNNTKANNKKFNINLFYQNEENLQGLFDGMMASDGCCTDLSKIHFTNTSKSLINAIKILGLYLNYNVGMLSNSHPNKTNGKHNDCLRIFFTKQTEKCPIRYKILEDDNFYYLKVKNTEIIKNMKTKVYDLSIENEHNYLLYNMLVHNSSGGFLLNTLFGFSTMDRLASPVKLFPERFLTEDRVKAGSLVDIDFNVSNAKPFIQAQKEVMGDIHSYPMLSFGKVKPKSGFKMYARSQNLDFTIANEISKQIDLFEKAYKHANEEDREHINIYDYIEEEYHRYIKASESYLGIVVDKKIAPCSHILYSNKDIRRKIGVMKLTNKTTKEDVLCACIEGLTADKLGFLKNDILTVTVLDIISAVYQKIGIPIHTTNELSQIVENNDKVWDIYKNGLTICINQCESGSTTNKAMKYQPKNISELTAFIASIRPSFKSMYSTFESRKPFSYGIKAFDELIQTPQMPNSFILYQEQLMQTFNFAGFPITECYTIIKAVAKKVPEKLMKLKSQFKEGFGQKIKEVQPELTDEQVNSYCDKVWQIAEDSANYSFNASHALAYAYDSLYCAYLKSHYPYEFYTVILELYSDKGEKDRVKEIIKEMKKGFGIELGKYEFGIDNRHFIVDKENNKINPNLKALKGIGKKTSYELYDIPKDINNFIDLLIYIRENTSIKKNEIEILINIGYFKKFGGGKKLLQIYQEFYKIWAKNNSEKTKDKKRDKLIELFTTIPNKDFSEIEKIKMDIEYLGETYKTISNIPENIFMVVDMELNYSNYTIDLLRICDAEIIKVRISESDFKLNPFIKLAILRNVKLYITKYGNIKLNNYSIYVENENI